MVFLQGQAVTVNLTGFWLWVIFILAGIAIGVRYRIRATLIYTVIALLIYPIFVRGGIELYGVLQRLLALLPTLVQTITQNPDLAAFFDITLPFDVIQIPIDWRIILFTAIGYFGGWFLNRINFPGWYTTKIYEHKEKWAPHLSIINGALLAMLWVSAFRIFSQDANFDGEDSIILSAMNTLTFGYSNQVFSLLIDLGWIPIILTSLFLGILFIFNFKKIFSTPPQMVG